MSQAVVTEPVWEPDERRAHASAMARFMRHCAHRYGFPADYASLYRWSLESTADFWNAVAEFGDVQFAEPPTRVFRPGAALHEAQWFDGARLNYAEHLLGAADDSIAVIFRDEAGRRRELTRRQLDERVRRLATRLQALGLQPGDRVAAILPNCPEAVIAMLACAATGLVYSSCSPDFGGQTLLARFGQIRPRLLLACDGYRYGGKRIDCRGTMMRLVEQLPTVERLAVVPFLDAMPALPDALPGGAVCCEFSTLLGDEPLASLPVFPFAHPLFILYSSGTTGLPKCIVHGAGGTLLQHLKEHLLHTDLGPDSRLLYFTTCGWMMWNWLVSALATGATIVLYDGSPSHPAERSLWDIVAEERVTVFGTSPRFLTVSEKSGGALPALPELRTVLSTGAPLAPHSYDFVRASLGRKVQLCSISGGTDLISCFVLGNPLLPVYRGEIQGPGLGMAVDVVDEHGRPVRGQCGELICTRPFPSMPLGFWNNADGSRYRAAYFERFPGVWAQGDLAEWTVHGGMIIYGRADAVLNPGGVRIGTAEVCGPALTVPEVTEAMAVGQRRDGDERIVLFVVLAEGAELNEALRETIRATIRAAASPRHVPAVIVAVPDLPRTISGKTVEIAVRAILHGEAVANRGALANPAALDYFRDLPELA